MILDNRTLGPEERMGETERDPQVDEIIDFAVFVWMKMALSDLLPSSEKIVIDFLKYCLDNGTNPSYLNWHNFVKENQE